MNGDLLMGLVLPGLATWIGCAGVVLLRKPSERLLAVMLGLTAGVMLAATCFSLLVPAVTQGGAGTAVVGLMAGGLLMAGLERITPHLHARLREPHEPQLPEQARREQRALLLFSALTLHNIPEGMAVGVAWASGGAEAGLAVSVAIGLQNIPEGFAATVPFVAAGARRRVAAGLGAASGLVEPLAAGLAFVAATSIAGLLPGGLAFAGGAMLFVVCTELIPESHAGSNARSASLALLIGFALMMWLDTALA